MSKAIQELYGCPPNSWIKEGAMTGLSLSVNYGEDWKEAMSKEIDKEHRNNITFKHRKAIGLTFTVTKKATVDNPLIPGARGPIIVSAEYDLTCLDLLTILEARNLWHELIEHNKK